MQEADRGDQMNTPELTLAFHRTQEQRYEFMIPNSHFQQGYEMDIMCVRKTSKMVEEIEIKTSRSDFLADFRKTVGRGRMKHDALQKGQLTANYFCFLVPHDLLSKIQDDIPEYAGIYTGYIATDWRHREAGMIRMIRKPKRLHTNKPSPALLYKKARGATFRMWKVMHQQAIEKESK
jgi:hypothetical protein